MSFIKKYDVGSAALDLPYQNLVYNKHIVGFKYRMQEINLDLVYNSGLGNVFGFRSGVKLNLQKKLNTTVVSNVTIPTSLIDSNGRTITLTGDNGSYITTDGSGRIVRAISNVDEKFELSDLAGNRETFNNSGNILNVYDKYNSTPLLRYFYSSGVLHAIVCPDYRGFVFEVVGNTTSILFLKHITVSGQTITYQSTDVVCTSTLNYSNGLTVGHYLGASLVFTFGTGRNLTVQSKAGTTVKEELTSVESGSTTTITHKINSIKKSENKFAVLVANQGRAVFVDLEDIFGAKKRLEYTCNMGSMLKCSYEIDNSNEDSSFDGNKYKGAVAIYDKDGVAGTLGYEHGSAMSNFITTPVLTLKHNTLGAGRYVLSGWVKTDSGGNPVTVSIYNNRYCQPTQLVAAETFTYMPYAHWRFVYKVFDLPTQKSVFVQITSNSTFDYKDFRINSSDYTIGTVDEYLMVGNTRHYLDSITNYKIVQNGIEQEKVYSLNKITHNDFMRYIANLKLGVHTSELTYQNYHSLFGGISSLAVQFGNGAYTSITSATKVGKRVVKGQHTVESDFMCIAGDNPFDIETTTTLTTASGSSSYLTQQVLDSKFDVVDEYKDGLQTQYNRNLSGLLTSKYIRKSGLTKRTLYAPVDNDGTYGFSVTVTSESDEQTKYNTDKIWGDLVRIETPNGTVKTYTYTSMHDAIASVSFSDGTNTISNSMTYTDGYLSTVVHGDVDYAFSNTAGEVTSVAKDSTNIESIVYANNYHTKTSTFPTASGYNYTSKKVLNKHAQLTQFVQIGTLDNTYNVNSTIDDSDVFTGSITGYANAVLSSSSDMSAMEETKYGYNNGLLQKVLTYDDNTPATLLRKEVFSYDDIQRQNADSFIFDAANLKIAELDTGYVSALDSKVASLTNKINLLPSISTTLEYDALERYETKVASLNSKYFKKTYGYYNGGTTTSDRLTSYNDYVKIGSSETLTHSVAITYGRTGTNEDKGLITAENDSVDTNNVFSYDYDAFGRLTRENNKPLNKTFVYTYNAIGNITDVKAYAYQTGATPTGTYSQKTYSYDTTNKDRLVSFNSSSIAYNLQGCPTSYLGKTIQWKWGRIFRVQSGNTLMGKDSCYYTFNSKGQLKQTAYTFTKGTTTLLYYTKSRTTKFKYAHDGRLVNEYIDEVDQSDVHTYIDFVYMYDDAGICGCRMTVNGISNDYYFVKNHKGDVVEIYNNSGNLVAQYAYEAYGNCSTLISTDYNIATHNHIRYRGYYYEQNLGMYWLQTRFYDANTGRFISPDATQYLDTDTVHGVNLYAYCGNCPTMFADPSGHIALLTAILVGAAIGAAVGFGATLLADYKDDGVIFNGSISSGAYIGNTLIGGAIGALFGALIGVAPELLGSSITPALSYAGVGAAGVAITAELEIVSAVGVAGLLGYLLAVIGKSGGYEISHHYPNDHDPLHVHIKGDDIIHGETRVGIDGEVLKGNSPLTPGAKRAFYKLLNKILEALKPWI